MSSNPEHDSLLYRILEPELMDDEAQAVAYARADFSGSNQLFVDLLAQGAAGGLRQAIDIGCGPADVVARLVRAVPGLHVTAIDGSAPMIALAREAVAAAGIADRVTLRLARIPDPTLPARAFDAVLSKDLLHHLPDPAVLWQEVGRLGRPGAIVHVMDLMRAASREDARAMVEAVVGREAPILKEDFFNSLCAAFTVDEVRAQIASAGLPLRVEPVSDRHLLVSGHL